MFLNNRYLLQDHIVHDPMATTYRGIDTHTLQGVSIIVLRETPGDDQKFVRRFQQEASLNTVHIHDYGQCDGKYFLVIDLIEDVHLVEKLSQLLTKNLH